MRSIERTWSFLEGSTLDRPSSDGDRLEDELRLKEGQRELLRSSVKTDWLPFPIDGVRYPPSSPTARRRSSFLNHPDTN